MRDTWLEERLEAQKLSAPPPGHRWLAEYTPQEVATIQRSAWDGRERISNHFLKSRLVAGHVQTAWFHDELDRKIEHTSGDRNGFCSSQRRADDNFIGLCAQRTWRTPPLQPLDAPTRQRIAERRSADEQKVRQRYARRVDQQKRAARCMLQSVGVPRPGSRQAKEQRERAEGNASRRPASARASSSSSSFSAPAPEDDERYDDDDENDAAAALRRSHSAASSSPSAPSGVPLEPAFARWQRQFADGKGHTERLTGQYVHSLGDMGQISRVPAAYGTPGKQRLTEAKANAFFSDSLRQHSPRPAPASSSPRLGWAAQQRGRQQRGGPRSGSRGVRV